MKNQVYPWHLKLACWVLVAVVLAASDPLSAQSAPAGPSAPSVTFEEQVLPVLQAHCVKCHSGSAPQAGLDVRSRASLLKGGTNGAAIVVGSAEESLLYQRVRKGEMPMGGERLSEQDLGQIRRWIDAGAPAAHAEALPPPEPGTTAADRNHWAFRPPRRPSTPRLKNESRVRTPIDAFLLAALEEKELTFSSQADRVTLMRRAYFDLLGLPPTPQEVDRFLADSSFDAYEKLIDRLLASPHYGERWGRHWLDIAGYADSEGGEAADQLRDLAWRYRDYIIRAFNADKPYDRFLQEQIAGDELSRYWEHDGLPPDVVESLEATGFLRMAADGTMATHPDGLNTHYLWRMLFDTEQIVGSALMGVSLHCARCHDHKYEPISQKDYYRLQAILAGAIRPKSPQLVTKERRISEATSAEQEAAKTVNEPLEEVVKALKSLQQARLAQYRARHPKKTEATEEEVREMFSEYAAIAERLKKELEEEEAKRIHLPAIRALYDVDASPPHTYILPRGDFEKEGVLEVKPRVPAVLDDPDAPFKVPPPGLEAKTTGRRRAFAEWLTRPDHPVTARLMVNRIWAHHFGQGIVPSTDNFGKSGEPPTNQPLLDWLATEFVRQSWSVKSMHRLIMTSTAYRQGSRPRSDGLRIDPENHLLWRMTPRRIEAEIVRDAVLATAGTLETRLFGKPITTTTKPTGEVSSESEMASGRRSIYQIMRRSAPQSFLQVFDAPVMEVNCTRRTTSTTASQALALMNSEFIGAQAEHFAHRVLREAPPAAESPVDSSTVEYAFRLTLARKPTPTERDMLLTFVQKQAGRNADLSGEPLALRVYSNLGQTLLGANEFVYID